jgi:hypothetical protein
MSERMGIQLLDMNGCVSSEDRRTLTQSCSWKRAEDKKSDFPFWTQGRVLDPSWHLASDVTTQNSYTAHRPLCQFLYLVITHFLRSLWLFYMHTYTQVNVWLADIIHWFGLIYCSFGHLTQNLQMRTFADLYFLLVSCRHVYILHEADWRVWILYYIHRKSQRRDRVITAALYSERSQVQI